MRVKVVKAGKPTYWYAKEMGSIHEVEEEVFPDEVMRYHCLDDSSCYIEADDATIVHECEHPHRPVEFSFMGIAFKICHACLDDLYFDLSTKLQRDYIEQQRESEYK